MDPEIDDDAAAMAQAMGFSSFGAQDRPQKKRRYNPAADSSNSSTQLQKTSHDASTGSNSTPLGTQRTKSLNSDEVALEDEDEQQDSSIATVTANDPLQELEEQSTTTAVPLHLTGLPARPAAASTLPGSSHEQSSNGRPGMGQKSAQDGSHKLWYEGYYDSTSNENPWQRLETTMGLKSRGTWVSRQPLQPSATSTAT